MEETNFTTKATKHALSNAEESMKFGNKEIRTLRVLRITILERFRALRKSSGAPTVSCRIDKKIQSHHEAHEGHEERKKGLENRSDFNMILSAFVNFVTFVVKCLFLSWLRLCRAVSFVVKAKFKHTRYVCYG